MKSEEKRRMGSEEKRRMGSEEKRRMGSEEILEFISRGPMLGCGYWSARLLQDRFGGEVMYNAAEDCFAVEIGGEMWNWGGMVESREGWVCWWLYEINDREKSEEIINKQGRL